jgi:hypothetical protein
MIRLVLTLIAATAVAYLTVHPATVANITAQEAAPWQ